MTGTLLAIAWKSKPRTPMQTAAEALVAAQTGIAGDFRGAAIDRQLTIVFQEDWEAACRDLGAHVPWTARRANLLVEGLANPRRAGGIIRVGEIALAVTGETAPCSRMDAERDGLRAALTPDWRGGLTTRVVEGGRIAIGNAVRLEG
jgi:MOSC domain-containing protein YiiM